MKKALILTLLAVSVLVFSLSLAISFRAFTRRTSEVVFEHGYYSKNLYDHAYDQATKTTAVNAESAIVAHHLLVADKVAEVFVALQSDDIRTIVLISPNHFSAGREEAQIGAVSYTTPYGIVDPNAEVIQSLLNAYPPLSLENRTFKGEHGISTLTPFIKRSFPNAQLVPIVLHESMPTEEAQYFGRILAETVDAKTLVIASIDMSHNLPLDYQLFHDEVTMGVIAGGVKHAIGVELEIDANAVLRTLLSYNEQKEAEAFTLTHHGSSLLMEKTNDPQENTSHILGYFSKGLPDPRGLFSLLLTDDLTLLEQFGRQPFYERDRRAFGTHDMMSRSAFFDSGLACPGIEKTIGTVGLFFYGPKCMISVIN